MSELNQVIGVHVYECGWVGRHMQYVIYKKIWDVAIQTDSEFKVIKNCLDINYAKILSKP